MLEITYHKEGDFFVPDLYLEKEDYEKRIQKQVEKYERDLKCGGIDDRGNFTRLHDRHAPG